MVVVQTELTSLLKGWHPESHALGTMWSYSAVPGGHQASPWLQQTFATSLTSERVIWDAQLSYLGFAALALYSNDLIPVKTSTKEHCDHFKFEGYISFPPTL